MSVVLRPPRALRIGTRGSALAIAQAGIVVDALERAGSRCVLDPIVTEGDRRAPDTAWGEGAFVSAIEQALLDGRIDAAVHSAKDVPTDEDPRLRIAAYLPREDPRDVLVLPAGAPPLDDLARLRPGAVVGTDSPRRTAFLRALRPDLTFRPLHGNVDTRLRRLDRGDADVLVLAAAGLRRLGRTERISLALDPGDLPPAPGQGALAVQVRADDAAAATIVAPLDDGPTRVAVEAERSLLRASGGGCRAPVGALATVTGGTLALIGGYARPDGSLRAVDAVAGPVEDAAALAAALLDRLAASLAEGARGEPAPRVIVTRPPDRAAATILAFVDRGLAPLLVPAIAVEPLPVELAIDGFDWVVVTSANAIRALVASVAGGRIPGPRWAAVGPGTAEALRSAGIEAAFRAGRTSGTALADGLPIRPGDRVLLPRGDLADETLPGRLAERGALVETMSVYRTVEAPPTSGPMLAAALDDAPAAWVAASPSAVRGTLALAEAVGVLDRLRSLPLVAIGPTTAAEAAAHDLFPAAVASEPTAAAIAEAAAAIAGAAAAAVPFPQEAP